MNFRKPNFLRALLLLLCYAHLGSTAEQPKDSAHLCVTVTNVVTCSVPEAHIQELTSLDVHAGQTVMLSLQNIKEDPNCYFKQRGRYSLQQAFMVEDSGNYNVICSNGHRNYSLSITVNVKPALRKPLKPQLNFYRENFEDTVYLTCISEGNPTPNNVWYYNDDPIKTQIKRQTKSILDSFLHYKSVIKCCAKNSEGEQCTEVYDYDLASASRDREASLIMLSTGQSMTLRCKLEGEHDPKLQWFFNKTMVRSEPAKSYEVYQMYLFISSASNAHSGEYLCKSADNRTKSTHVQVLDQGFIDILELTGDNNIPAIAQADFCFQAQVHAYPDVQCNWITPSGEKLPCKKSKDFWGNITFQLCGPEAGDYQVHLWNEDITISKNLSLCVTDLPKPDLIKDDESVICQTNTSVPNSITWMTRPSQADSVDPTPWKEVPVGEVYSMDSDRYCHKLFFTSTPCMERENKQVKCCVTNIAGTQCSEAILVQSSSTNSFILMVAFIVLLLAFLLVSMALLHFIKKKRPVYQSQLQMIQVVGPSESDYIYIDFRDFKYDQKWEFPRENLELGKELGSGAFGMVLQATAYGISQPGVPVQVAVKMLKDRHQTVEKEALMSELKMLTHIGHHPNIVNLLGACTDTGPVYLIFQYCCYGDLLNYLKNNRERFHKSLTDAFTRDRFSSLYHNCQKKRHSNELIHPDDKLYMTMSPVKTAQESIALLSQMSTSTDTTENTFEGSDLQEDDMQTLTFDDLLCFSHQVAKGMAFLSSKNCIHRDLAARNVLVTQGRLVKIGDFGLARDIDNDSNYVVRGNVRLPVKWMAPESIFKGMYTMQSDVWAYGILLWEIFSLGVTPYPGTKVDSHFYALIERGFQMERPYYASESVYNVMRRCWALEPQDRPQFSKLVVFMENEIAEMEEKLYHGQQSNTYSIYQNTLMSSNSSKVEDDQRQHQPPSIYSNCKTEDSGEVLIPADPNAKPADL